MNNDEAKFLLRAYRPGGRDADDPAMGAALEQAKRDPALAAWFAREQAHDAAVANKLRTLAPPPGLREAILMGARLSEAKPPVRSAWWRRPAWLSVAAAVLLLLGLGGWWGLAPIHGASLEEYAVNFVDHGFRLQKHSADVAQLKAWLAERHGPLPTALPAEFAQLRALGCRTLNFRGRDVSMMCFERGGKEFHVFVARRDDLSTGAVETTPRFQDHGRLVASTWSDAKNHYVVVSDAGMEALKKVL